MKSTVIVLATFFAIPAIAETPNRVTMNFEEFVNASGCIIVDKGGYSNLATVDGGNCPQAVVTAFSGTGSILKGPGLDGVFGTPDDIYGADN